MTDQPQSDAARPAQDDTVDTAAEPKVDETDWKAKAREWEKRAKDNKSAADELASIKESQKTDAEKQAERIKALESDAATARTEALRLRVASKFGISDDDADLFLTGTDEESLTRQAKRLADRESDKKKQGNYVPREGNQPGNASDNDDAVARRILLGQ